MTIIAVIGLFLIFLIGMFVVFKGKKALSIVLVLVGIIIVSVGGYFFYSSSKDKQEIQAYFNYFEEQFQFSDTANNYQVEPDPSRKPELLFSFSSYNKDYSFNNNKLTAETDSLLGVKTLRRHIYVHYKAYLLNAFIYDQSLGNDFKQVEDYLSNKGYELDWDFPPYREEEQSSFDLYNDQTDQINLRINGSNDEPSLEEELSFYKQQSMEDFPYLDYMDYFSYHVHLVGEYSAEDEEGAIIQEELKQVLQAAITNKRITITLTKSHE